MEEEKRQHVPVGKQGKTRMKKRVTEAGRVR